MTPRLIPLLLALLLAAPALPARADEHGEARRLRESGEILPLRQILRQVDGRVLNVELEHRHGRYVYEVQILDRGGQVWERHYDAGSGQLLRSERGR